MAKVPCYVCKKLGGHFHTIKDYWRSPQTPDGMTESDFVCYECYHEVKGEVIRYKKENKEEIKKLDKQKKEEIKKLDKKQKYEEAIIEGEIENKYDKFDVIRYKDDYCAILHRNPGKGNEIQFIKEFSRLTQEGYRMMAQDEGGSFNVGIGTVGTDSFYFFQKIEYISLGNNK